MRVPLEEHVMVCRPDGMRLNALIDGRTVVLRDAEGIARSRWRLEGSTTAPILSPAGELQSPAAPHDVLAAVEVALAHRPDAPMLKLIAPGTLLPDVLAHQADEAGVAQVCRDMFWQQARMWLPAPTLPYPLQYAMTDGKRHPRRPQKRQGTLYQRHIPWLGRTLSLRSLDISRDLDLFNRWMNDPVVAHFWQEEGDLAKHRAYLEGIAADPHMQTLIACLDDHPFGYFEVYWAKENRIAPFYDAHDYDRGWHVLIGESSFRGKPFATAWFPSIAHYLFLDDCRTQRIVGEPRIDHHRQIRNLERSGYARIKDFDFPHKRAALVMLLRERFFGDALWHPRPDAPAHQD
ncbi:GNAT family N-acetyltransferase [Paucibacter sp. XJ19-41]|uniref:GNAT family N-acetyltransferase n=1 Tax=Paucibacter sp. XJ19-41 TaxID=2927824 RepID=UPI00234B4CC5|nr:GNAT family N-acetyltransferase [Paucibacter sp. XJ19-41]MDC6169763.1 GNAT family N-acetyltransferase [Paucibacter sp. XJ19-41]